MTQLAMQVLFTLLETTWWIFFRLARFMVHYTVYGILVLSITSERFDYHFPFGGTSDSGISAAVASRKFPQAKQLRVTSILRVSIKNITGIQKKTWESTNATSQKPESRASRIWRGAIVESVMRRCFPRLFSGWWSIAKLSRITMILISNGS